MLILERRLGEAVVLGDGVTVTVFDVRPGRVRLGVETPREVRVLRGELVPPQVRPTATTEER